MDGVTVDDMHVELSTAYADPTEVDRAATAAVAAVKATPATHPLPGGQEFFHTSDRDTVRDELVDIIGWHHRNHPRNLQVELGPSEIGHPCSRKLALSIIDAPHCNPGFDWLPSEIGIGYHARLQQHFDAENERIGWKRWLTETTVWPWPGLHGNADLFDVQYGRVLDWKILGDSSYKKMQLHGPKVSYDRQRQLYGRGFEVAGYEVRQVGIVAIPKAGTSWGTRVYLADYDPQVTQDVWDRWNNLLVLVDILQPAKNPEAINSFEAVGEDCHFCPWFKKEPDAYYQCAGPNPK